MPSKQLSALALTFPQPDWHHSCSLQGETGKSVGKHYHQIQVLIHRQSHTDTHTHTSQQSADPSREATDLERNCLLQPKCNSFN